MMWEYETLSIESHEALSWPAVREKLNTMGHDGWEAFAVLTSEPNQTAKTCSLVYQFKRWVPSDDE